MPSSTTARPDAAIERARPLLGTIVTIRIDDLDAASAHALADAAFAEMAVVHRLMSFQDAQSELSRINRDAAKEAVAISGRTHACLRRALDLAELSNGVFDPVAAASADGNGDGAGWRDVDLKRGAVRLARPLRIDLSGIAKGYAVDRACALLSHGGVSSAVVNAGGDLRVLGSDEEAVALRPFDEADPAMISIGDGALASSDTRSARAQGNGRHIDGRTRAVSPDRFASVAAPLCMDADALTKIVLAEGSDCRELLLRVGAIAYLHEDGGWTIIGEGA